jgi:hypothetical protein
LNQEAFMSDIVAPSWHFYKIMQPLMTVSEWTAASLEVEPLAKKRSTTHALGTAVAVLCGYYPQAEARLSTQRAAVEDAEAAVQEALRRLREAEVRLGAQHTSISWSSRLLFQFEQPASAGSDSLPRLFLLLCWGHSICRLEQSALIDLK